MVWIETSALAEHVLGDGLHVVGKPQRQGRGRWAGDLVEGGMHARGRCHAHAVAPAATLLWRIVGDWLGRDEGLRQNAPAKLRVMLQGRQAPIEEPGVGLAEIEGRQWIESRRDQPVPEQESRSRPDADQQDEPKHAKAARACCGGRRRRWHDSIYNGGPADGQAAWAGSRLQRPSAPPTAARALKTSRKAKKMQAKLRGLGHPRTGHRQRQRTQQAPVSERRAGPAAGIATSEVGGNAIFFPIPVTGGLGSAPPADLWARGSGGTASLGLAASLLCFRQGALCLRRQGLGGLRRALGAVFAASATLRG